MDLFPNLKRDLTVTLILALPATLVVLAAGVGQVGRPTSAEAPVGTLDVGLLRQEATKAPTPPSSGERKSESTSKRAEDAKPKPRSDPADLKKTEAQPVSEGGTQPKDAMPASTLVDNLAPNAVEKEPQPINALNKDEVRKIIVEYQGWCREGKIQLVLALGGVSPTQLNAIVGCYILTSSTLGTKVRVESGGEGRLIGGEPTDRGEPSESRPDTTTMVRLCGPLDRLCWPKEVHAAARKFFGSAVDATATFELSDEGMLLVYRALGEAKPKQGTSYRLGLSVDSKSNRPALRVLGVVN